MGRNSKDNEFLSSLLRAKANKTKSLADANFVVITKSWKGRKEGKKGKEGCHVSFLTGPLWELKIELLSLF